MKYVYEMPEEMLKECEHKGRVVVHQFPGENYEFYTIPGGVHDMKAWQLHLYHALQVFFTK